MTDIAMYADPRHIDPTGGRLVAWASSLTAAKQIGTALCNTSFVPASFKGKPEEAAAAILFGDEVGLTPTQALQSVYVISGKPALYARAMVAIVLAAGHEIETVTKTDNEVSVRGRRRGSEAWITEKWTKERATKAGYTNNKKYSSDPQSMLYARAASDICRQIAPDALAGIGYSVEEMELVEKQDTTTVISRGEAKSVKRKPQAAVEAAPAEETVDTETGEIVDAEIVVDEPQPSADLIGQSQSKMMFALMRSIGITERDDALAYAISVIDRDVESSSELTKGEASHVIDALNADKAARDAIQPTLDD